MKLYKCQMLDESMEDYEPCVVAVMEDENEQQIYYANKCDETRKTLLADSGYNPDDHKIEFWFPYEMDGYQYAAKIEQNISQSVCDADYIDFEYIEPQRKMVKPQESKD